VKITITSTAQITRLDGCPVRLWEGVTESGIRCHVFVRMLAVSRADDSAEFDRELIEQLPPGESVSLSLIL
jgi:hypothetical protein